MQIQKIITVVAATLVLTGAVVGGTAVASRTSCRWRKCRPGQALDHSTHGELRLRIRTPSSRVIRPGRKRPIRRKTRLRVRVVRRGPTWNGVW